MITRRNDNMKKYCEYCGTDIELPKYKKDNKHWKWVIDKNMNDGGRFACKKYFIDYQKKYNRTKKGWAIIQWNTQKLSSKRRNHPHPNYSSDELYNWALQQPNFKKLFNDWVNSNYKKDLKPSCDRLNDMGYYTLENLRIITQKENILLGARSQKTKARMKNSIQNKMGKPVLQLDLNDNLIKEYITIGEASRQTAIDKSFISKVCRGILKTAGGYKWKFKIIKGDE
jgi:hypothetical protein